MFNEKYVEETMLKLNETKKFLEERMTIKPKIAIILGSGLGPLADLVEDKIAINYKDIPNFPYSTVPGHKGELIFGKLDGVEVILMNGRFHYYEGWDIRDTAFPIRLFKLLGIENLVLSNAAGGLNENFEKGDLMIINDHLSFFAESVLRGANFDEFGPRFPGMLNCYDKDNIEKLKPIMKEVTGKCLEGCYAYMKGPTYESKAEIKALCTLGADAVGMSTVPEAVVAAHCGIKTTGITCITNMSVGSKFDVASHEDVKETAKKAENNFKQVVTKFIKTL